jgi:hypothetical protein
MGNGVSAFGVRPQDVPKLLMRCEKAAARKAERGAATLVWGPTWSGRSPVELAEIGGEDGDAWVRERAPEEEPVKRCGCGRDEMCEDCVPEYVRRRWEAGCGCIGSEVCIDCCDPTLLTGNECA